MSDGDADGKGGGGDEEHDPLRAWLETQCELTMLMAHDLRNPIAAVLTNLNYLDLDRRGESPGPLGDLRISAETLLRLVDNLVTIARLEARAAKGARPADESPVDLASAVRDAPARLGVLLREADVSLVADVADAAVFVRGETALVVQLIDALVLNVTQHARRSTATMTVVPHDHDVEIVVRDEGPAYGPVERDFSRLGQLELHARADARYSRGLGLYAIGLAVRALGGTIDTVPDEANGDASHGYLAVRLPRYE